MAPYATASYAEVLRWFEDTEIQYVPQGKKPGTKSFDRYEKYSQAKTVVQALDLGSKPLDLLHDYEKKLLTQVGGPIREKPLRIEEVEDKTKLTKTDLMFGKWAIYLDSQDGATKASTEDRKIEQREAFRKAKLEMRGEESAKPKLGKQAEPKATGDDALQFMKKKLSVPGGFLARVRAASATSAAPVQPAEISSSSLGSAAPVQPAKIVSSSFGSVAPVPLEGKGEDPVKPVRPKKKLGAVGGLLARVQKRAQGRDDSPEAEPEPASTPPSKRARTDGADDVPDMALSGKKVEPASTKSLKQSFGQGVFEMAPVRPALPADPTCHHFNRLAAVLVADGELAEASRAIAEHMQAIARSVKAPESMLRATMFFLDPQAIMPDRIIAAAIGQAYALPDRPCLKGEALAAQALSVCQAHADSASALSIEDVEAETRAAHGELGEEPEAASSRLAKLLGSAQNGMEAFYLVRSLQGKLAPSKQAMQLAVAKALVN